MNLTEAGSRLGWFPAVGSSEELQKIHIMWPSTSIKKEHVYDKVYGGNMKRYFVF